MHADISGSSGYSFVVNERAVVVRSYSSVCNLASGDAVNERLFKSGTKKSACDKAVGAHANSDAVLLPLVWLVKAIFHTFVVHSIYKKKRRSRKESRRGTEERKVDNRDHHNRQLRGCTDSGMRGGRIPYCITHLSAK